MSGPNLETRRQSRLVSRSPVFYGWIIVTIGILGMVMTAPGQAYLFSIFLESVTRDLGASHTSVSTLYTVASLAGSATLPVVGRRIDRHGSRVMVVAMAAGLGLSCLFMGRVQNIVTLGAGFVALRAFGSGGLALVSENVINQWWRYRRGAIVGLSSMVYALAAVAVLPNVVSRLLPLWGWRGAYTAMGLLLLTVMVPLGYLFFRDQPEQYGLQPDGRRAAPGPPDVAGLLPRVEVNWTLPEALRTTTFWVVSAGIGILAMLVTGMLFHLVAILGDNGLSPQTAATALISIALAMALFSLGSGILLDRVPARLLLCAALLILTLSLGLAVRAHTLLTAMLFGVLVGTASALMRTLSSAIWAIYFGRLHLGSITGLARAIVIGGAALGPMPFGIVRDLAGSYRPALLGAAAVACLVALGSLAIPDPQRRHVSGPEL